MAKLKGDYTPSLKNVLEYFKAKEVNSGLLRASYNPRTLWKALYEEKEEDNVTPRHFIVGGATDALLTQSKAIFEKEYVFMDCEKPGGKMKIFTENLLPGLTDESNGSNFESAYKKSEFKGNMENIIKKFWSDVSAVTYYNKLSEAKNKAVISPEEMTEINYTTTQLLKSKFTKKYFNNPNNLYQVDIRWVFQGIACKSLLDILEIDYQNKTLRVVDLKTTAQSLNQFERNVMKFGYLLQVAFYTLAVEYWKDNIEVEFSDFIILPPQFIACETSAKFNNAPRIFQVSEDDLHFAINGGNIYGVYSKGIKDLANLYEWHIDSDEWEYSPDLLTSEGIQNMRIYEGTPKEIKHEKEIIKIVQFEKSKGKDKADGKRSIP